MKILVTGASGMIGNNIAKHLLNNGHQVYHTSHPNENPVGGISLGSNFVNLDWKSLGKIDAIMHQAAITDTLVTDKKLMMQVNFRDAMTLFEKALDHGCKIIVYASSCAVYGDVPVPFVENGPKNPLNVYAESKLKLDEAAMKLTDDGVCVVGLRYSNVFGPGEKHKKHSASMVYQLAQQMTASTPKLFEFGEQKRDFVYVEDVVNANMAVLKWRQSGIFNCGSGKARSFNDIIKALNAIRGTDIKPDYIKNPYQEAYQNLTECDMSMIKKRIRHVPSHSLESGIAAYHASGLLF